MPMNGIDRCVWLSISPGSTKQPGRVDHRRALGRADLTDSGDRLALDQHVAAELVVGGDDGPAGDEGVVSHLVSPRVQLWGLLLSACRESRS